MFRWKKKPFPEDIWVKYFHLKKGLGTFELSKNGRDNVLKVKFSARCSVTFSILTITLRSLELQFFLCDAIHQSTELISEFLPKDKGHQFDR